jgi:formylglycine-generating enzyme required for sulfatase activity
MCGNFWEWVDDDQKPTPDNLKQLQAHLDPKLKMDDAYYVIRGGYFGIKLLPQLLTESASFPAHLASLNIGFRCAKTPDSR